MPWPGMVNLQVFLTDASSKAPQHAKHMAYNLLTGSRPVLPTQTLNQHLERVLHHPDAATTGHVQRTNRLNRQQPLLATVWAISTWNGALVLRANSTCSKGSSAGIALVEQVGMFVKQEMPSNALVATCCLPARQPEHTFRCTHTQGWIGVRL